MNIATKTFQELPKRPTLLPRLSRMIHFGFQDPLSRSPKGGNNATKLSKTHRQVGPFTTLPQKPTRWVNIATKSPQDRLTYSPRSSKILQDRPTLAPRFAKLAQHGLPDLPDRSPGGGNSAIKTIKHIK